MNLSLSETSRIVGGCMAGADVSFSSVSIDTRRLRQGDLYIAIVGENFDAHEFIETAASRGAVAAIVERETDIELPKVLVGNTRIALGSLAREWRNRCGTPVVGVTGSNGKTTVKELIAAILGVDGQVLYTQGNLNNDIGVPLTLLRLNEDMQYAVIEMGANHHGEIAYTSSLTGPDVAVITNAGSAHLEGFGSVTGVAKAKGELVENLGDGGIAVLNVDDRFFGFWKQLAGTNRVIGFGLGSQADVRATDIEMNCSLAGFNNRFTMCYKGTETPINLRLAGQHNVCNAMAAAGAVLALGVSTEQIKEGLENAMPMRGRMQPVAGRCGSLLIDDTYNANPSSFDAAIDVVSQLNGELCVILGGFAELGDSSHELHEKVGRYARKCGVSHLLATGPDAVDAVNAFGDGAFFFSNQQDLIEASSAMLKRNVIVLVKGSRSQKMERVIEALQAKELN